MEQLIWFWAGLFTPLLIFVAWMWIAGCEHVKVTFTYKGDKPPSGGSPQARCTCTTMTVQTGANSCPLHTGLQTEARCMCSSLLIDPCRRPKILGHDACCPAVEHLPLLVRE